VSKFRRAAKIDNNQPEIVKELRKRGYSVEVNHDDILVGYRGKTYWYEIKEPQLVSTKTGEIRPSALKDSQKILLESYKGHYRVVWDVQQIIDEING